MICTRFYKMRAICAETNKEMYETLVHILRTHTHTHLLYPFDMGESNNRLFSSISFKSLFGFAVNHLQIECNCKSLKLE